LNVANVIEELIYKQGGYVDRIAFLFLQILELSNYERIVRMKILELFAGTRSISKSFEEKGHETFTIELDETHPNITMYADVLTVTAEMILEKFGRPDVIWCSPPCTTYSMAGISHHRIKGKDNLEPITELAKISDELVKHSLKLIEELQPKYWFIENPRAGLRSMEFMKGVPRHTVTYCQYQDFRMKPTDLWTNHPSPNFKPPCKNGDKCHESAPRGSQTGTQRFKTAKEKAVIPKELCDYIVTICE
jgi:C-5 cytosine-specific DNA methylase